MINEELITLIKHYKELVEVNNMCKDYITDKDLKIAILELKRDLKDLIETLKK